MASVIPFQTEQRPASAHKVPLEGYVEVRRGWYPPCKMLGDVVGAAHEPGGDPTHTLDRPRPPFLRSPAKSHAIPTAGVPSTVSTTTFGDCSPEIADGHLAHAARLRIAGPARGDPPQVNPGFETTRVLFTASRAKDGRPEQGPTAWSEMTKSSSEPHP